MFNSIWSKLNMKIRIRARKKKLLDHLLVRRQSKNETKISVQVRWCGSPPEPDST